LAVKSRAVSVATTATRLDSTTDQDDASSGQAVAVYNNGASTVYLGGSAVTTATGAPVAAGAWGPGFDLTISDQLYGIVASGTVEVRVIETGIV
jgi:hypothetical protein